MSSQVPDHRSLILVYIHGFMGNERTFQEFPDHVHDLVAPLLKATHQVTTHVYPRYKSKQHISVASQQFSQWLDKRKGGNEDIILLGHSMGGLLAAEVVLTKNTDKLKHRILGTINLDVPFLGMHHGIVKAGLASRGGPEGVLPIDADSMPIASPEPSFWSKALCFVDKHSDSVVRSTQTMLTSHFEHGLAISDFENLRKRYVQLRLLEEQDESVRAGVQDVAKPVPRVRFVNYYTASTGHSRPVESTVKTRDVNEQQQAEDDTSRTVTLVDPAEARSSNKLVKDQLFCRLPPNDASGLRDPAWVRVEMRDMDSVIAHCALFSSHLPSYRSFVDEVARRIHLWVGECAVTVSQI